MAPNEYSNDERISKDTFDEAKEFEVDLVCRDCRSSDESRSCAFAPKKNLAGDLRSTKVTRKKMTS